MSPSRMNVKTLSLLSAAIFAFLGTAVPASAEIVVLTSGRTISVKAHRVDGDLIVLTLRSGGDVTCDKSLIEKILPDEVPYPEPKAADALSQAIGQNDVVNPALLEQTPYGEIIASMSEAHGVDPMLVRALIQVESNYRPKAKSNKGAMGLMQLMPATAREYKLRNPYDPTANIGAGVKHLKSLIDRMGAIELALAAYNAGEGAVKKFNGIPPYRETRNYVSRILAIAGIK
ncbi:MAG: lytic transglycosylase domain-containing protein [Vicinamibacterales bacterium]